MITPEEFSRLRYGMIVHYGLYSATGRGEWEINRARFSRAEADREAAAFDPSRFDADALCRLAVDGGMKYIVFTTMHHDGFRLYDTALSPRNSMRMNGRDLVAEVVAAARAHGLKIALYHSLNNLYDQPDGVDALENPAARRVFVDAAFARLRELVERFRPFDVLWYDGWWPLNAAGWEAERMNAEMGRLLPGVLFNGRNGLPGDFGTPERHLTAPDPWRPWEAGITLNDHWGFHAADHNWKSPLSVVQMLLTCANRRGNLLLNVGPRGDGVVPEASAEIIRKVGAWLRDEGGAEAVEDPETLTFGPEIRQPGDRGDWDGQGVFTAKDHRLFLTMLYPLPGPYTLTGLETRVERVDSPRGPLDFRQEDDRLTVAIPDDLARRFCPVLKMTCATKPSIYRTGGMRVPNVEHPRYDPCPPDLLY